MTVTRKPVAQHTNLSSKPSSPPYPITPVSSNPQSSFPTEDDRNAVFSASHAEFNVWNEDHSSPDLSSIPESLRVGPSRTNPKSSQDMLKPNPPTTNPFLRRQQSQISQGTVPEGKESSADIWNELTETPAHPDYPPPLPPSVSQVTQEISNMEVSEQNTNPWRPVVDEKQPTQTPNLQREDSGKEAWSSANELHVITPPDISENLQQPALVHVDEPESPAWDEDGYEEGEGEEKIPVSPQKPISATHETREILEDQHAWDSAHDQISSQTQTTQPSGHAQSPSPPADGWDLIDHDVLPNKVQQSGIIAIDGTEDSGIPSEEDRPALPPRNSRKNPPPQPPRPIVHTTNSTSSIAKSGTPASTRKEKKEMYEIKKISWHGVNAQHNPRVSPILVQNANGPCPLLALVNALTLSTPAGVETALIDTLRSREQVSLGLLLDAVFDELMSGRRGDAAQDLPDVGDLYSFLLSLHTGMNVNPLFFPTVATQSANDTQKSMTNTHPVQREGSLPGAFEETREMKLYGTFSVPLIHGWLPEEESPAYMALKRSARSYEDAQNLMFHEEVLEDKLATEGLSLEEQGILEDIATIKAFFVSAATQLTAHGLDLITTSMSPGAVAILFRNDHFSTIFRHPTTLQLLQLVTDSGYAGHEEVVWEGLIDVNGERAEFYSGDFRLVSGASTSHQGNEEGNWTTVTGRRNNNRSEASHHAPPGKQGGSDNHNQMTNAEQEDHDLALAMQLQEEEDEHERNEIAQRRRESELSQQYIDQQGNNNNNSSPVNRRGGSGRGGNGRGDDDRGVRTGSDRGVNIPVRGSTRGCPSIQGRPAIPPRNNTVAAPCVDPEAGIDAPPPSYEQAATEPAYQPSNNHLAHPNTNSSRGTSAHTATSNSHQSSSAMSRGRRNTHSTGGHGRARPTIDQVHGRRITSANQGPSNAQQERQRDCIIM
ncbi:hypothetical protein DSL72_006109 [Monilinia vaccinii-corymbosi]|uniref:MINDY deubiquitinase domain-containing protein n=1 Tax=Monilinia vaccinii-corymbosi TaxID=61207 RepID=A0A8A3PHK0_9HELO|nr:hypothetical protein DSL72_006109 [Monilinia vaccinii-corymbosi]